MNMTKLLLVFKQVLWIDTSRLFQEDLDLEGEEEDEDEEDFPEGLDMYKMVLVVNSQLNMGVGKIAAQCSHAALQIHRIMIEQPDKFGEMLMSWEQFGYTPLKYYNDYCCHFLFNVSHFTQLL